MIRIIKGKRSASGPFNGRALIAAVNASVEYEPRNGDVPDSPAGACAPAS